MRHLGLDLGGTYIKWVVLEGDAIVADGKLETRATNGPEAVVRRLIGVAIRPGAIAFTRIPSRP